MNGINTNDLYFGTRQDAEYQYRLIIQTIYDFESNLDNEHEIALHLTSFGQSMLLNVTKITYNNPSMICFHGFVNGNYSTLIQHISQISFMITSVPKQIKTKPPRRIGFLPANDE